MKLNQLKNAVKEILNVNVKATGKQVKLALKEMGINAGDLRKKDSWLEIYSILLASKQEQEQEQEQTVNGEWHEVLGIDISKVYTFDMVRAAYRKLALKYHPDRGGDKAAFQKINAAYEQYRTRYAA